MNYLLKPLWLVLLISSFIISCTESPNNDGDAKAAPVIPEIRQGDFPFDTLKTPSHIFGPGELATAEIEAKKNANLVKPIIYGKGGAGITLDTTYEESRQLLTPPFRGPFSDGATLYNEQIIVVWNLQGSRKPFIIYLMKGYLGKLDVGGKFGQVDFQTKFKEYKTQNPIEGAAALTREMYRALEGADEDYDCLADGECRLIFGTQTQANMVMVFPGAVFLMAKEEFQIAEIRIFRNTDPGILANNLDLMTGDILVPGEAPLSLGQTKEDIFTQILADQQKKIDPEIFINADSFVYSWQGVYEVFHRTNYVNTAKEAEASDVSTAIQVTDLFPAYLTIDGQRIIMTQSPGSVEFEIEQIPDPLTAGLDNIQLGIDTTESKLKMTTPIYLENAQEFSDKFAEFLKGELSKKYDVVLSRSFGHQNQIRKQKEISTSVRAYNKSDLKGLSLGYEVSEEQRKLNFIAVSTIDKEIEPFNRLTLPASTEDLQREDVLMPVLNTETQEPVLELVDGKPVLDEETGQPKIKMALQKREAFHGLAGIRLNDLVRLTDVDNLGRGEATVEYISDKPELQGIVERTDFTELGTFMEPADERLKPREQSYVNVGMGGTLLGIKMIGQAEEGLYARVVSIGTGNLYGFVQDVCGLGLSARFKIGMTDDKAVETLNSAIADKKKMDPDFECRFMTIRDEGNLGLVKQIYFVNERLILDFSNRALAAVSIYLPLTDVDTTLPEVKQ